MVTHKAPRVEVHIYFWQATSDHLPMSNKAIEAHLAKFKEPHRSALKALRATLQAALPGATEKMSYRMPAFHIDGEGVAAYDAFKAHCSYFPMSGSVIAAVGARAEKYATTNGTLQFDPAKGLPVALVRSLVRARIKEINAKFPTKGGVAKSFYPNGFLRTTGKVKGDGPLKALHGNWSWFRKDGSLMRTGQFKDGAQVGTWRTFDRSGKLVKEAKF